MVPTSEIQRHFTLQSGSSIGKLVVATKRERAIRVCFDPRVRIRTVPSLDSFSNEEIQSCWYSREDLDLIQVDICHTLMLMETNESIDETTQCLRGLERRTRTAIETTRRERAQMLEAVAREYYMQKQYGNDSSVLAVMYGRRCEQDSESAHLVGTVDEDDALRIFLQDMADMFTSREEDEEEEYSYQGIPEACDDIQWDQSLLVLHGSYIDYLEGNKRANYMIDKEIRDDTKGERRNFPRPSARVLKSSGIGATAA